MSVVCNGSKIADIVSRLIVSVYCFSKRKKGNMDSDKNHETEVKNLHELVDCLQRENQRLKELLEQAGIDYSSCLEENAAARSVPDQRKRILPFAITESVARHFFARFWGREDVYAKRSVNKKTGKAGYFPQCDNFWYYGVCPKANKVKIQCNKCENQSYSKLGIVQVMEHLKGEKEDASDVIGVYPLLPDDTCRFIVFDFDNHEKGAEEKDFANTDDKWKEEVDAVRTICKEQGIDALVERSRSGRGAHLWIFFAERIPAKLARKFGFALLDKGAETVNMKSFRYYDRMLPAQNHVSDGSIGNLIALPLQGQALKEGNSAFIDGNWNAYPDQWKALMQTKRLSKEKLEGCIKNWLPENPFESGGENEETRIKPWEYQQKFHQEDITGSMKIVLSNLIYVDTKNLKYRLQNQVRRLAAFLNPVYFKNQRIGYSNYQESRTVYMGQDESGYIGIPRGLYDELMQRCHEAGIKCHIEDERTVGRIIDVTFQGKLRESQVPAVEKMLEHDTGILSAATAFGKTVVCSKLIAERKVSTLILLESSALIGQWMDALQDFLDIREQLPEYQTPSGRTRKRKSVIGRIQGAHDSSTGIIDIAMVGSLCKKGEIHPRLQEYGLVIMDECHHAATATVIEILQAVKAKYVYGVTATPMRSDGLEKIGYMLLGNIRYRYTAKDRAKEQGIEHLVYPRFTRVAYPRSQEMHINDAYMLIKDNEVRNGQIAADVKKCIDYGRTPVVLTRYKEHASLLSEKLQVYADKLFLLSGDKSKKELQKIREQMEEVSADETMILVATGQMVGEGFDCPRLDTLIMATPVSWKGIVEQYAGRLNRDYAGKKNVVIYDYVDSHIDKFDKMYGKRLKAYRQIGYQICTNISTEKQEAGAIYDFENYHEVFERDLQEAEKDIIISSPQMNRKKVYRMVSLLKERQEAGVKVTIVTWHPDCYKYGKSEVRMELLEQLRNMGFEIQLMEEGCEHYTVVDQKIVWYGNMDFLSKEDMEDNLMRVISGDIAAEIMEMTFGREKELMDC